MNRTANIALLIVILALSGYLGFRAFMYFSPAPEPDPWEAVLTTPEVRPDFSLDDMDGKTRSITEWDGKATLINFWASWCKPCITEIPILAGMQEQYGPAGLQVIGISVDVSEDYEDARAMAEKLGANYPLLVGELDAIEVASRYGADLYGLPWSVLVAKDGRIIKHHVGDIKADEVAEVIEALLGKPNDNP